MIAGTVVRRGPEVPGRPEGPGFPEACPCFFFLLLFHAWPWSLDSPWSSRLYLIMHSTHVGGSSHVSHVGSESSERSDFTLCPMAYVRGLVICPPGAWGVVGVYMGMNVGCSASTPPLGKDPTSDRDPHHHGNGCRRRTCSWTKLKTWRNPSSPRCRRSDRHAKRANTSNTRKYNGYRTQSVHHVRMSP